MTDTTAGVLIALVALTALLALVLAGVALRTQRSPRDPGKPLPTDVEGLRGVVASLRDDVSGVLRRPGLVRYDAFGDMGGRLSWSLALLDGRGDGVVLTSIHGRSDARSYAKTVKGWVGEQQLSDEEAEAVKQARSAVSD